MAMSTALAIAPAPSAAKANTPTVRLDLRVFLEGADQPGLATMRTDLNDRMLLPSTMGGEVLTASGPDDPVDWVQLEIRDGADPTVLVETVHAIVESDGDIVHSMVGGPLRAKLAKSSYYIVVRHKSHLPVSSTLLTVTSNNRLEFDWTVSDVGPFPGFHQTDADGDGRWAMIAGNTVQAGNSDLYDINPADLQRWQLENGNFGVYSSSDVNMDGDVNGADKILIADRNGLWTQIPQVP